MARPSLDRNPKFKRLVRTLGVPKPHVRGYLELLWDVAYECGNPVIGDSHAIEAAAEWPGKEGEFTTALLEAGGSGRSGFIDAVEGEDGIYQIHDLDDHAPDYVKKRRQRELERTSPAKTAKFDHPKAKQSGGQRPPTADNGGQNQTLAENGKTPTPAPTPIKREAKASPSSKAEPSREDFELAEHMLSTIVAIAPHAMGTKPAQRPITIQRWANELRLMREQDGRGPPEIRKVFDWANRDTFWRSNILSAKKLREKFDTLKLRMAGDHGGSRQDNSTVGTASRERNL